jgi:hypothetical protein
MKNIIFEFRTKIQRQGGRDYFTIPKIKNHHLEMEREGASNWLGIKKVEAILKKLKLVTDYRRYVYLDETPECVTVTPGFLAKVRIELEYNLLTEGREQ